MLCGPFVKRMGGRLFSTLVVFGMTVITVVVALVDSADAAAAGFNTGDGAGGMEGALLAVNEPLADDVWDSALI